MTLTSDSGTGATAPDGHRLQLVSSGSRAWLVVALLTAFLIVNFADKVVVGLSGVDLMKDLDISAQQFGLVQSSFYWLFALGSILGGLLIGRVPAKWLLAGTATLWVLAMLPMVWSESFTVLVVSRALLGFAEGPATAMAIAVVHSWFTADRRTLPTSVVTAGAGLGPLIAAPLLTLVIVSHSWHAAFGAGARRVGVDSVVARVRSLGQCRFDACRFDACRFDACRFDACRFAFGRVGISRGWAGGGHG